MLRTPWPESRPPAEVAGAFLVLFWRQKITVFASLLLILNKRLQTPVWLYFLAFVVLNELTGALRTETTGTAHLAHLGGFGVGILLTWHWARAHTMPQGFVFPYEVREFETLNKLSDSHARRTVLKTLLFHNPLNRMVLKALCRELSESKKTWPEYPRAMRELITGSAREQMSDLLDAHKFEDLADLISSLRSSWPIQELVPVLSEYRRVSLMKAIDNHPSKAELSPLFEKKGA